MKRARRPHGEAAFWSEHPARQLLAEASAGANLDELPTASGHRLTRTYGVCMWPGIREGDLIFYAPLGAEAPVPAVGEIAVARAQGGPVAHRVRRVFGARGRERLVLGGDLSGSDAPRERRDILGVVKAIYRPGMGFVELPERLEVGPLGGAVLQFAGRFFTWAQKRSAGH